MKNELLNAINEFYILHQAYKYNDEHIVSNFSGLNLEIAHISNVEAHINIRNLYNNKVSGYEDVCLMIEVGDSNFRLFFHHSINNGVCFEHAICIAKQIKSIIEFKE